MISEICFFLEKYALYQFICQITASIFSVYFFSLYFFFKFWRSIFMLAFPFLFLKSWLSITFKCEQKNPKNKQTNKKQIR